MSLLDDPDLLVATVPDVGEALGLSRDAAYRAARSGSIPTIRLGRKIYVPIPKLRALLGADEPTEASR